MVKNDYSLVTHNPPWMGPPTIFCTFKFENWPKIQCFGLYRWGLWGKSFQYFPCDVSYVQENLFLHFWLLPPKILELKSLDLNFAILQLYVIVRPLSTVGYTSIAASVIHSRQWSN